MTYSLIVTREHYKLLSLQWYEKSVLTSKKWKEKQGNNNVDCLLNMNSSFISYLEKVNHISLHNDWSHHCDDFSFLQKTASFQGNYLVAAGLTDVQIEIIKHSYPVLVEYIPCFVSEIYVFAKEGDPVVGMQEIYSEAYTWDTPIPDSDEFIPIKECNLSDICPSRFTKLLLTFDYQCSDPAANYALVLQTSYKEKIVDWRCVKPSDFFIKDGDNFRSFLPFRYELLIKDSKKIPHYSVKIFLWNIDKTNTVQPVKCTVSTFKSNPYIYAMGENMR
jgi:hypothetical protein